ncbi:hypothetical protein [Klebsiella variicola]|uniref:hypothetical protein n=1 Tax=Klebsiella variicola TaxID=244366 RepID=UPI0004A10053|nr:hypothetical protein [Klebsiella variicola]KDL60579.1 hypothetical protein AD94_01755 [Klebsiella variicola]
MTISRQGLDALEADINESLESECIEITFSGHFTKDRVNDPRNKPMITLKELESIFKQFKAIHAQTVVGYSSSDTFVLKCNNSKINLPCIVELIRKFNQPWVRITVMTVMRKPVFLSNDKYELFVN